MIPSRATARIRFDMGELILSDPGVEFGRREGGWRRSHSTGPGLATAVADLDPRDSERMQNELIVETEHCGIADGFPGVHDVEVPGDAPGLVTKHTRAVLTG